MGSLGYIQIDAPTKADREKNNEKHPKHKKINNKFRKNLGKKTKAYLESA